MKKELYKYQSFLGKGWGFPPTFHLETHKGVEMVDNIEDIQQSLEILLNTNLGERMMLPEFGCNLQAFLFESIDKSKMYLLESIIRTAIIKYESRIELHEVQIDIENYLDGIIKVNLDYSVISTNTRFNLVFPYYKVEGTNIPFRYSSHINKVHDQ